MTCTSSRWRGTPRTPDRTIRPCRLRRPPGQAPEAADVPAVPIAPARRPDLHVLPAQKASERGARAIRALAIGSAIAVNAERITISGGAASFRQSNAQIAPLCAVLSAEYLAYLSIQIGGYTRVCCRMFDHALRSASGGYLH